MATDPGPDRGGFRRSYRRFLAWVRLNVPPGLRLLLGIVIMVGGVFGFLPILGFWMIPLGLAIAALDIRPLWRRFRGR
ncbi:hypothetical protein [Aliiroseovarius sp.]|uniref:hypothetical protein n=1 Tax=Aliiroseovarius sp. TaxID=1872442 RepID=UPI003BACB188